MNLEIGVGIDRIRFGMLEADVVSQLGPPDKAYRSDWDRHLVYFDRRLDLWLGDDEGEAALDRVCSSRSASLGTPRAR